MEYRNTTISEMVEDSVTPVAGSTPPDTPYFHSEKSAVASTSGFSTSNEQRYFRSRRVKKDEVQKPWMEKKDPREKWIYWLPIAGIFLGIAICGVLVWEGLSTVTNYRYCSILDEDFSSGSIDTSIWLQEVEVGGYGNGEFEWTTADGENAYIEDGKLVIKPTLTDTTLLTTDTVINLLETGTCTGTTWAQCVTSTNTTNGTIVQPVKSARLSTINSKSIKFGKVEVTARLPEGDWLWPAIWMLPTDNVYGAWPRSGEIDIMESRGNNYTYAQGGDNVISSTLHWGPDSYNDAYYLTNYKLTALHTTYADGYNTFGLEWSAKYLFTYVNSRLLQVGYTKFSTSFWDRGDFPASNSSGDQLVDPWVGGTDATPFDRDFYLILNVAVGGTNGWFADGKSGKPWVDDDAQAKTEFIDAKDEWYPTWTKNGKMTVKSVKMWQQTGYNGCTA